MVPTTGSLPIPDASMEDYVNLLQEVMELKKSLTMVSKITNSERLLALSKRLAEILPVLPGTIEGIRIAGNEQHGENRKRYAHVGVQFVELEKVLAEKKEIVDANLLTLSDTEEDFLSGSSAVEEDDPSGDDSDDDSAESSEQDPPTD